MERDVFISCKHELSVSRLIRYFGVKSPSPFYPIVKDFAKILYAEVKDHKCHSVKELELIHWTYSDPFVYPPAEIIELFTKGRRVYFGRLSEIRMVYGDGHWRKAIFNFDWDYQSKDFDLVVGDIV